MMKVVAGDLLNTYFKAEGQFAKMRMFNKTL